MKKSLNKVSKRSEAIKFKKVLELAKKIVRERDKFCRAKGQGRTKNGYELPCWGYLQASHIKPEGLYRHLACDLDNMIGMCTNHHLYWWHKDIQEAAQWCENYIGKEKWRDLQERGRKNILVDKVFLQKKYEELNKI